jgi:ABC-2 type transport system permease protein
MATSILSRSSGFTSGQGSSGPVERARRVWEFRRILSLLIGRDIRVRYASSMLGYVWAVLDPLALSAVYWFLFTQVITRKVGFPPYILFLVAGQLVWQWINSSINTSLNALRSESQMVRSSNVPRELWVLRVVLSQGVQYIFSLPVLAVFAIVYSKVPNHDILLLPLAMLMTVLLGTGIGLILAPAAVLVRDLRSIVRIATRALFFLSPILYSLHDVAKKRASVAEFVSWNPITGIMALFRSPFFPQELDWTDVAHSAIVIGALFVIGLWTFSRLERPMLKEV